jgi:glutathione synthase/RimK-type ligase-like ATP-grasp enzyme
VTHEDDVFEVEDSEAVIVKLISGMGGDDVAELPDQRAEVTDGHLGHDSA